MQTAFAWQSSHGFFSGTERQKNVDVVKVPKMRLRKAKSLLNVVLEVILCHFPTRVSGDSHPLMLEVSSYDIQKSCNIKSLFFKVYSKCLQF